MDSNLIKELRELIQYYRTFVDTHENKKEILSQTEKALIKLIKNANER